MGLSNPHDNPEKTRVSERGCDKATLLERSRDGLCIQDNLQFLFPLLRLPISQMKGPSYGVEFKVRSYYFLQGSSSEG